MAPVNRFSKDVWGWGHIRKYSAGLGFFTLQSSMGPCSSPAIWKDVWSSPYLPKEFFFTWLLLHRRVLTGENLQMQGFNGTFRCCFCNISEETSDHIFSNYEFLIMYGRWFYLAYPLQHHLTALHLYFSPLGMKGFQAAKIGFLAIRSTLRSGRSYGW